jgi:hypothetical protein
MVNPEWFTWSPGSGYLPCWTRVLLVSCRRSGAGFAPRKVSRLYRARRNLPPGRGSHGVFDGGEIKSRASRLEPRTPPSGERGRSLSDRAGGPPLNSAWTIQVQGAPSVRFLQGRASMQPIELMPSFAVPTFRKPRKVAASRCIGAKMGQPPRTGDKVRVTGHRRCDAVRWA